MQDYDFIFHREYRKRISGLSMEQRGVLFTALAEYAETGAVTTEMDDITDMAFGFLQDRMDRDYDNFLEKNEKNRKNGMKGGRPPKMQENPTVNTGNPKNPTVSENNPENPTVNTGNPKNPTVSENNPENPTVNTGNPKNPLPIPEPIPVPDIKRESVREKRERFSPPTPGQVTEYAKQAGLIIDAEKFCDYYASKGWKVGPSSPMKDWKAAARNWARNDSKYSQPSQTARSGTRGNFCAYGHEQIDWNALGKMISNNGSG
jgi:hypothetical protein